MHTFLSCMRTLFRFFAYPPVLLGPVFSTVARLLSVMVLYMDFCHPDRSHLTTFSTFVGSCPSTSALTRRSTKGRMRVRRAAASSFAVAAGGRVANASTLVASSADVAASPSVSTPMSPRRPSLSTASTTGLS